MEKEVKAEIIAKFATHPGDTGSPEVQIALLTYRINHLTEHLKMHKKDHHRAEVYCRWSVPDAVYSTISKLST